MTAFKFDKIKNINNLSNLNKPKVENLVKNNSQTSKVLSECDANCDFPNLNDVNVGPTPINITFPPINIPPLNFNIPSLTDINNAFDSLILDINQSLDVLASNDVRLYNDLEGIHTFLQDLTNGLSQTFGCFCNFKLPDLDPLCPSPCPINFPIVE